MATRQRARRSACTRSSSRGFPDSERAQFARDGYLVVVQLFTTEEMAQLREREQALAQPGIALQSASQQAEPAVAASSASVPSYAESLRKPKHVAVKKSEREPVRVAVGIA